MLVSKFGLAVFAAITSLVPSTFAQDDDNSNDDISQSVQSTFVSPDGSLTFGFSWPDDGTDDIYFALRVRRAVAWGAVGLGSDDMPGALYLMIYENHDGDDVNFSPRLSEGHYEPQYHGDIHVERMPGTTINKKDMLFVGRCTNCLNWPSFHGQGGNINLTSTTETCIYGFGPDEGFATDNVQEGIKFHEQYGVFEIDMNRTRGATEPPRADRKLRSDGTRLIRHVDGAADVQSIVHGIVMMFCFVGLMPLGIVILRFGGWARWHAINQTVAMVGVLVGFALGIVVSFRYQRSRGFNAAHQVVGMLATAFILGQFALGFLHHRKFKQTHQPTRYGTTHLWFGRAIIVLGIMNAFFGLTFALNRRYGIVLGAIVIFVILCALAFIIGRRWLDNRRLMRGNVRPSTRHSRGPYAGGMPAGQYRPPSRQAQPAQRSPHERRATHQTSHRDIEHDPSDPPPSYETSSSSQTISLGPINPQRGQERKEEVRETTTSTQSPREFS